jgi:hypothetical protein
MTCATNEAQLHACCWVDNREKLFVTCRINDYVGQ